MESMRIKSNARKSTYSGKPSASNQEQLRMRQALRPEPNANHVPVKLSTTTWKRSGWSLSARVRHSSREELLTPMSINKDKESSPDAAASNGDLSSGFVNTENVASSGMKIDDQRSLWSLFSAPKVHENVNGNASQVDSISNSSSRAQDKLSTSTSVHNVPSRDPRIRRREESEKEDSTKISPLSFSLLSKMKPLKNASRNFFAHLSKKLDVSPNEDTGKTSKADKVSLDTQSNTQNDASEVHESRLGDRTMGALRKENLDDSRSDDARKVDNHEQNCRRLSLREQVTAHLKKERTDGNIEEKKNSAVIEHSRMIKSNSHMTNIEGKSALSSKAQSVPKNCTQVEDSSIAEGDEGETTSLTKQGVELSKDVTMPTLTLPAEIELNGDTSNMSNELDESECLFIDEEAHADDPSGSDEDSSKVEDDGKSHVLRVWSLQSDGETSKDFQNVDFGSSFSGDANTSLGLSDSFPSTGSDSLNSSIVSQTEKETRSAERLHEGENSGALSEDSRSKNLKTIDAAHRNAERSMPMRRRSEEGPPKLQVQPDTHHLLQELDSLLECSTLQSDSHSNLQLEASEDSNMQTEASEDSNLQPEASEDESETNSLDHSKESENTCGNITESARNIFSLFSGGRKPLPPRNIVKLDNFNPTEQFTRNLHLSTPSEDSTVVSGICSDERKSLTRTEGNETGNASCSNKTPDTELPTLLSLTSHDAPVITLSGNESSETVLTTSPNVKSADTQIPSLTPETDVRDGQAVGQNNICLRSSQPPELCLEESLPSLGEKEASETSTVFPVAEEDSVDDITFLAFETRDDLFSYSKRMRLKLQRKLTQTTRVPAKKLIYPVVKNVKMKKKKKNPVEAKIKALEQHLLRSMEICGLKEIVHPVLSRRGVALDTVWKHDLVVNVRKEELERTPHKKLKHNIKHSSRTEVRPTADVRWQGKKSNSVEISGLKHEHYSSLHVRKSSGDKDHDTEHVRKSSDTGKVVGLKHGHLQGLQKNISKVQSSGNSDKQTEIKRSKPKHSSSRQEWEICPEVLNATSERPSLKLKFISKARANSTSPTKVEQSPLALSTKPRESTVPLKSPTSHIPVNVQQLHLPSSSVSNKNVVPVTSKPVEEKAKPVEEKPLPSTRLPVEESLPFKPFEKPVASKKSAFVSDALEDLLQGVDISNKMKPLISPSTISVSAAKVVYKVPSRQSHSVKTLDMALKRQKPLKVSSPNCGSEKVVSGLANPYHGSIDEKKKKKKKKKKEKHKEKGKIEEGYVFGTGPDDLVRKLPKLPFASYGRTYARPLFARDQKDSDAVGKKSKGFLEVRNVLSMSGKATVKRQSDEMEVQSDEMTLQSVKKIKQEPEEVSEEQAPTDEKIPPILNINLPSSGNDRDVLKENSDVKCKESLSDDGQAQSKIKAVKKCEEYCRLGCICDSLDNSRSVQEMSSHCRRVDCMFECVCKKSSSQAITGTRVRRPPTYSHDMLFYDDSYKFWKVGDNESTSVEVKKLQLLDHLPAWEKRNLVSSCARTRHFVTDKPEKWIKWKRKQQKGEATHLDKERTSELNANYLLTPEVSNAHVVSSKQGPPNETQVSVKQQKSSQKQRFIRLLGPSEIQQQNQDSTSKSDDPKSKVRNVPAPATIPVSHAVNSAQGNAGISQKVMSTFLPVTKQYMLNGNLMNMVVLPNGNRVLLPATTTISVRAVEQKKTSTDARVKGLSSMVGGSQSQASVIPPHSTEPAVNTSAKSTMQQEGLKPPVLKTCSAVPSVTTGFQRPVLPVQLQITSSGITVTPKVIEASSAPVTTERSSTSQGTTPQGNQKILQKCGTVTQPVVKARKEPGVRLNQPVVEARKEPGVQPNLSQHKDLPQLSSKMNKISVPAQAYLVINPPVKAKPSISVATTTSKLSDSRLSLQGCISIKSVSTESVRSSAVSVQKQEHTVTKLEVEDCSLSESTCQEDKKETPSATSRTFLGDSEMSLSRITKTLFTEIGHKRMNVTIFSDAEFDWTDTIECEVNQAISKSFDFGKPKQSLHVHKDMELNLCDKGDSWVHFRLTKHKPSEGSGHEMADESKKQTDNNTDAPNLSEEGNIKAKASTVKQPDSVATHGVTDDMTQIDLQSSNISDALAGHASNGSDTLPEHESQYPLGDVLLTVRNAKENTSKPAERTSPVMSIDSGTSKARSETPSKVPPSGAIAKTLSETQKTPGASRSSSGKISATSKALDGSPSMSENEKEDSKKLSSSLPEFDKLSKIVKQTSADEDDELSPIMKITRNVSDWLHDPKIAKVCDVQSYSGVKGPWFTTEKEGVQVVLQRNKNKRSPFGKGSKFLSKQSLERISKQPTTSSVLIRSPTKCKPEEVVVSNKKGLYSDFDEGKVLNRGEVEKPRDICSDELEQNEKPESHHKDKRELLKDDFKSFPRTDTTLADMEKSSDLEKQCYLPESSGLFLDSNAIDSEYVSNSQIDEKVEEGAPDLAVNSSKNSSINEKTMIDGRSEQQDGDVASAGSNPSKAISPSSDTKFVDGKGEEAEIGHDDTEGTLGIEHFARFSEEDAYEPLDLDEEVSGSIDLVADCKDDSSSVASLRIDDDYDDDDITNDMSNADLEKSKLSSVKDHTQKCTESPEVKNLPSLLKDTILAETTPVKKSNILPKKSPVLNIKFVATSNENCTSPLCLSPVCPSPVDMSPLSEDVAENTQDRSPNPFRSESTSPVVRQERLTVKSKCPSPVFPFPLSEDVENKTQEKPTSPTKSKCPSPVFSFPLPKDVENKTQERPTSPTKSKCPSPVFPFPLSEDVENETQERRTSPIESNCPSPGSTPRLSEDLAENTEDRLASPTKSKCTPLSDDLGGNTHDISSAPSKSECQSLQCTSPLSEDLRENTQERSAASINSKCPSSGSTAPLSADPPVTTQDRSATPTKSKCTSLQSEDHTENKQGRSTTPTTSEGPSVLSEDLTGNKQDQSTVPTKSKCLSPVCSSPLSSDLAESKRETPETPTKCPDPSPAATDCTNQSNASLSDTEIDVVNSDDEKDEEEEIDVETVTGLTPAVQNLNPYSSLRDITLRLSSALQKKQKVDKPKAIKRKSPGTSSFRLLIGHSMGSPRHGKLKQSRLNMNSPKHVKLKQADPVPLKTVLQSSSTTHLKSKKKKSKRKSPVCPAKQWDSPHFQVVYRENSAREEEDRSDKSRRNLSSHNFLERRRREEMRKAFSVLSEAIHQECMLPALPKIQILKKAVMEIMELKKKEEELLNKKQEFKKQQRRLVYVHSNLLHHARCSGQIVFPEGSRLAESMERIRSGMKKHLPSTLPEDDSCRDSATDLQGKGTKRKAQDVEKILDSQLPKKEGHIAGIFASYLVSRKKKKSSEINASSQSEQKHSSSSGDPASTPKHKVKKRVRERVRYLPVTRKDLKTRLKYGSLAGEEISQTTALKGYQESVLDLSKPSGSREYSDSRLGMHDDSSSDNEESLPIECYVSSSDEPEEGDAVGFGMDDDEEMYSDDGFIPESEDESTAKVCDDEDENKGEREIVTINIDLDDFEQENAESRSGMESSSEVESRKKVVSNLKQRTQIKEESSLESADSDDDVLFISEQSDNSNSKHQKKQKERGTLRKQDDRTVWKRHENKSQSKTISLSGMDTMTKDIRTLPSGSKTSSGSSSVNQDSSHSTKMMDSLENQSGIKQEKAPLVDVIDEIMNRLRGNAPSSAGSSSEEHETDEGKGSGRAGVDVMDSSSVDKEEGNVKLVSKSSTLSTIQGKDEKVAANSKQKGTMLPSEERRSTGGGVLLNSVTLDDSDSSSDSDMDGQERTSVLEAVDIGLNSIQPKEKNVSAVLPKHGEDAQPSGAILDETDSSSDDEVDGQENTSAPSATKSNNVQNEEGKSRTMSLKTKEDEDPRVVALDDSDSSSEDEEDEPKNTIASKPVSVSIFHQEKGNHTEMEEQESLLPTSHTDFVGEKNLDLSLQKKTSALPMKGALADLISSVKTRVGNDDGSNASEDSESEDEEVEDEVEDNDSDDYSDDEGDESSEDEGMEVEEEREVAEDDSRSKGDSEKEDMADIGKDMAGPSYASGEVAQRSEKPGDSSDDTSMAESSSSAGRNEEGDKNRDRSSVDEAVNASLFIAEKSQVAEKQGKGSVGDDLTGPPFPDEIQDAFSVNEDITDDDVACLSYAAMGNDEDNEALIDAEKPTSPLSPLSLDLNIASDDDIDDTLNNLDEGPRTSSCQLPEASSSTAGTSTNDSKSRLQEARTEQSPTGHQNSSSSAKQDLTLDEAISFLNIEKNSDGTLNVFLKGDYDDEKLDELFEKPEVMDYIMSAAAKKS